MKGRKKAMHEDESNEGSGVDKNVRAAGAFSICVLGRLNLIHR